MLDLQRSGAVDGPRVDHVELECNQANAGVNEGTINSVQVQGQGKRRSEVHVDTEKLLLGMITMACMPGQER